MFSLLWFGRGLTRPRPHTREHSNNMNPLHVRIQTRWEHLLLRQIGKPCCCSTLLVLCGRILTPDSSPSQSNESWAFGMTIVAVFLFARQLCRTLVAQRVSYTLISFIVLLATTIFLLEISVTWTAWIYSLGALVLSVLNVSTVPSRFSPLCHQLWGTGRSVGRFDPIASHDLGPGFTVVSLSHTHKPSKMLDE